MEKNDLIDYLNVRIMHLELELQKIPFTQRNPEQQRDSNRTLNGRIKELHKLRLCLERLPPVIKYYYGKVKHLEKMKIYNIKSQNP